MELPRQSSDIALVFACTACNGNGGFGIRRDNPSAKGNNPFSPCTSCAGTGWKLVRVKDLTPAQKERIRNLLA